MGDEALVRERCGEVCRDKWGMDVFEDRLGTELARVDYFDVSFAPSGEIIVALESFCSFFFWLGEGWLKLTF